MGWGISFILLLSFGVGSLAQTVPQFEVLKPTPQNIAAGSRVLMIGETHYDTAPKNFLKEHLKDFKKMGFTHLGLEMINAIHQDQVDARLKSWEEIVSQDWGWRSEGYVEVLAEAERLGIKVVGLDGRNLLPVRISESWADFHSDNYFRDQYMAKSVSELLAKDPKFKLITWTGALHSSYWAHSDAPKGNRSFLRVLEQDYGVQARSVAVLAYAKNLKTEKYLKEQSLAHPSKLYYRAIYNREVGYGPAKALIETSRFEGGYDGILLWDEN